MYELVTPELEVGVLDKFDKGDQETPWMRSVHNQTFQKHSAKKFLVEMVADISTNMYHLSENLHFYGPNHSHVHVCNKKISKKPIR